MKEDIVYGVQAVMYYSGNGGCEADWFCIQCPFAKTFCDRLESNGELITPPDILSEQAEKWMIGNGIIDPMNWKKKEEDDQL